MRPQRMRRRRTKHKKHLDHREKGLVLVNNSMNKSMFMNFPSYKKKMLHYKCLCHFIPFKEIVLTPNSGELIGVFIIKSFLYRIVSLQCFVTIFMCLSNDYDTCCGTQ